ncbi:MAG: hypothetical protein WKG00_04935 [Polyangiaceae bacterium]
MNGAGSALVPSGEIDSRKAQMSTAAGSLPVHASSSSMKVCRHWFTERSRSISSPAQNVVRRVTPASNAPGRVRSAGASSTAWHVLHEKRLNGWREVSDEAKASAPRSAAVRSTTCAWGSGSDSAVQPSSAAAAALCTAVARLALTVPLRA